MFKYLTCSVLFFISIISGCGFHLRGDIAIPSKYKNINLVCSDMFSPFYQKFKMRLKQIDAINLVTQPSAANLTIELNDMYFSDNSIATNTTGLTQIYSVTINIPYKLISTVDKKILLDTTITQTKQINIVDPNNLLAHTSEIDTAKQELIDNVINLMLRQIEFALNPHYVDTSS